MKRMITSEKERTIALGTLMCIIIDTEICMDVYMYVCVHLCIYCIKLTWYMSKMTLSPTRGNIFDSHFLAVYEMDFFMLLIWQVIIPVSCNKFTLSIKTDNNMKLYR